jgi:hypothetical protein
MKIHLPADIRAAEKAVWRIRDVYPGSDFFPSRIPDPNCLHPGSRILIKEFKYFNPKKSQKWFLIMIRVVHPGSGCWLSPIPDPGSRGQKGTQSRIPNPGSGSATLGEGQKTDQRVWGVREKVWKELEAETTHGGAH